MIEKLTLANFKCFRSLTLELSAANVFAGTNGAGKSTVIQSLLALRQSWDSGGLAEGRLELIGPLADIGTAGEAYCAEPSSDSIRIAVNSTVGEVLDVICPQSEETSLEYFLRATERFPTADKLGVGLFGEPFNYLQAERLGPRKVSEILPDGRHPLSVGKYGESAASIITSDARNVDVTNDQLILRSSNEKEYRTLQFQWPLWMARVFPGFEVDFEVYQRADQVRLGLALQRMETGRPLYVRPTNTGFGISFVLGIIVAGLLARSDTMLVVENPEAHLHPRAQSAVGEFLGRVAAGGAQVFVETHSEHVVNGLRRMVKQMILTPAGLRLFFLSRDAKQFEPSVVPIEVSQKGTLSTWPDGFLDQLDSDLTTILE